MNHPTYTLTLEALPGGDVDRRLARLLKAALRQHGFKCRRVAQVEPEGVTAPAEESQ